MAVVGANGAPDGVVLVHGGMHTSRCWARLLPLLDLPAVAVDLPGRGTRPANLETVTLAACVNAVLEDADDAEFRRFVLVGHSMGGVTITETAVLHPERVAALVYIAAMVPRPGADPDLLRQDEVPPEPILQVPPEEITRTMFGNDLNDDDWAWHRAGLVPEARSLLLSHCSGTPSVDPTVYVMLLRDTVGTHDRVTEMSERLGDTITVHTIDAGHSVMVSRPAELARLINAIAACS